MEFIVFIMFLLGLLAMYLGENNIQSGRKTVGVLSIVLGAISSIISMILMLTTVFMYINR